MKGKRGQARGHKKATSKVVPIVPGTALALSRISEKGQDDKGFGKEGQTADALAYVERLGLRLIAPPIEVTESAFDEDNREEFERFMKMAESLGVEHLLFGRVDRSLRNFRDLHRLEKEARNGRVLHFFQEGFIYHKGSNVGDLFRLGIQGVAAMAESRTISERTKRVLRARALDGYWPQKASFGYMNVGEKDEPKRVEPDPSEERWLIRIKELSATGQYSLVRIIEKLKSEGCTLSLTPNLIERTIRNPFSAGRYEWDGELVTQVKHKPLITWELHVAAIRGLERYNKPKYRQHDWPYAGLIECALCGRAIVFETKQKKLKDGGVNAHTYAHCAGIRTAPDRKCPKCENANLKLAELEDALGNVVRPISMKREVVDHILAKLGAGANEEAMAKEMELATLKREIAKIETYIDGIIDLHIKHEVSEEQYKRKKGDWEQQRVTLQEKMRTLETSGPDSYLALARRVLEPTISLADKYFSMDPHKRASILRITCSNLKQDQKKIVPTYRTIYRFLASGNDSENWLRD